MRIRLLTQQNIRLQQSPWQATGLYITGLIFLAFSQFAYSAAKIEHWQTPQGTRVYYVHTDRSAHGGYPGCF
jgi:hypothetical protein